MPILRKESEIYPEDLFSIPLESAPWQIVHVKSRQEKAVARILLERRSPFYLPQVEKSVRRNGRTFRSYLPLFTGYVFVRTVETTKQALWASGVVVRVIAVEDQERLHHELQQLRALQQAGAILMARPDIAPGDAVRITTGVFAGYLGIVLRERDALRLIVSITALNKSVVAELPREAVVSVPVRR